MTTLTEPNTIGDVILWEEDGHYSREVVTIASGADLKIGSVLGKITATGKYALSAPGASDGSEDPAAILITDAAAASADVTNAIVIVRDARAIRAGLIFDATIDNETKRNTAVAALKAIGVIAE